MKRSEERILTTHVGSLTRPADLLAAGGAARDGGDGARGISAGPSDGDVGKTRIPRRRCLYGVAGTLGLNRGGRRLGV